ncbi:dephospho-CoA kinase [Salegentibacter chungangensis]|uniref:Dephospho-CoA kinase n=1 Tax=Salegentibacter chungangensis TaxID=1335724 RepID=A0ABW3NUQ5_9FLAO
MVIGLTGGIGSGKTTVAGFFKELGVPVYIADKQAKELMETSEEIRQGIVDLLGDEAYNGKFPNRKFIASKVFNNTEKLEKLNSIIHPAVENDFVQWKNKQSSAYVIYEAAILFEKGGYKKCDFNILVTAPKEDRVKRLQKRDQSSRDEIEARMNHQWSDEKKSELADFTIENTNLTQTKEQVRTLHRIILKSGKNS